MKFTRELKKVVHRDFHNKLFKYRKLHLKAEHELEYITDRDYLPILILYLNTGKLDENKIQDYINSAVESLKYLYKYYNVLVIPVQNRDSEVVVYGQNSATVQLNTNQSKLFDLADLLNTKTKEEIQDLSDIIKKQNNE